MQKIYKQPTSCPQKIYNIFGNKVNIKCFDEQLSKRVFYEFDLYPEVKNETEDFILEIYPEENVEQRIDQFVEHNVILIESRLGKTRYILKEGTLVCIVFTLHKPILKLHGLIQKFRHIGFKNRIERIGQILHELVIVPAVLFFDHLVPVHSSALRYNEEVILFGGQGGVGKTSLELEFCFYNNADFIADDISVLNENGLVYPNLSFPKIYAYNVLGYPKIKKKVVNQSRILNNFHWKYQLLKGRNKVRRRVSPAELYKNYLKKPEPINRYLILKRYAGDEFQIKKINAKEASQITVNILKEEFSGILNQLAQSEHPQIEVFNSEAIIKRWEKKLLHIFDSLSCEVVLIPEKLSHQKFKEKMMDIFS